MKYLTQGHNTVTPASPRTHPSFSKSKHESNTKSTISISSKKNTGKGSITVLPDWTRESDDFSDQIFQKENATPVNDMAQITSVLIVVDVANLDCCVMSDVIPVYFASLFQD